MERGSKSSWLCKIVKSVNTPADVLKLQRYLNKCGNEVPVIEEDTIEEFDRIFCSVFHQFELNGENHSYLMVILNCINFLSQKNCFADWMSSHERQAVFCTKFAVLMKSALKYISFYINVGDKEFLALLSVFKEIILKSAQHIYQKNVFLRALSHSILKVIVSGKVQFPVKKIFLDLMVNILEGTDRQTRSDTFHKVKSLLCMMLKLLHKIGDYKTQMSAVEIIIRFTTSVPNERVNIANSVQNKEISQRFAKFSPRNFEMECRIILNMLNQAYGQNSNVFTIACDKASVGNYIIKKPKHEDYKDLWVDFNLDSQSITVCCDGDSLMCVEENQIPEQNGYWEILTISSKNVRKLSIVPSDDSFSGKDDVNLMHLKLARPCDYIHATSADAISRCLEFCFYFKYSSEFKDLQDRILPQIFRGKLQERKVSETPDITLNVRQIIEQKTRGKSRQVAKNDQELNEESLRNNKNSESYRFNSYSKEKKTSEKLGDDPEKQLETLQAELLKEIMQESEIVGSKHTQTTNSADSSLKELYSRLAAHKFVQYSTLSPCAKKPDLSQICEALSNGKQSFTQKSTQKIFSNSVNVPIVQEIVTVNEQCAPEYVVNNTNSEETQKMVDTQKGMLQKGGNFCPENSGVLVAVGNVEQTNSKACAGNSVLNPIEAQLYGKPPSSQRDCVATTLSSGTDMMIKNTDVVPIIVKGSENGRSAVCNISSEQDEPILDNVGLKTTDVKGNQMLHETETESTNSVDNEDKLKCMSTQQKMVDIKNEPEIREDSGNTVSINSTTTKKSNKQLKQPSKIFGSSLKKGKLSISFQKSITEKNIENNRFENNTHSKPELFLKDDVAKVTSSSEKRQETTLTSSRSGIPENNSHADPKSPENVESESIGNLSQMTGRETSNVICKDVLVQVMPKNVKDIYEEPMKEPFKYLETVIFKTPNCETAGPPASDECNNKEKRKGKDECLKVKTKLSDEKLCHKSEIIARQISERGVEEGQGVSSSYTPTLSQQEILGLKDKCADAGGKDIQTNDLSLSSSNSSPLFQPMKKDSHLSLGREIGKKFFNTDKNSKSVETKVTYKKLCKKSNGKTEHKISGRRRLFSSEAGIEIINVLFSSKKYEQEPQKKLSSTASAKKANVATKKLLQHDVICKNGFSSRNPGKNTESFEISESDSSWHKIFPANCKEKSVSKNRTKKKTSKFKNITAENSNKHNFNRERKNKVVPEPSEVDTSWQNIFPTCSKKRYNYISTTEVKMSKHQKVTVNSKTGRPELKEKIGATVNYQNNSLHKKIGTECSFLPQQVLHTERMRGDSSGDEKDLLSSKDVLKEASEMFCIKKEDKSSFEDFPSLLVEKEKKLDIEQYKHIDDTETKEPNNSNDSLEAKDITSKNRVDISHSSDDNENHHRNQPLLQRMWEENCNKPHCSTYKRREAHNQAHKKNEIQSLINGTENISPSVSVRSKLSLKQIPERENRSSFGTSCIPHSLNTKSYNNQSNNSVRETKTSHNYTVEVPATCNLSKETFITSTKNYDPVESIVESNRSVKHHTVCGVQKPVSDTNTVNNANIQTSHLHNAHNRKLVSTSIGVNPRRTSTPYSIPGSVCFSSKTGISPIESVKNCAFRKNMGKFDVENSLNKPVGTSSCQLKHGLSTNNMNDSVCKEIESQPKYKETSLTIDSNEYSWEETESKNSHCGEKPDSPPKHFNKNHRRELPLTSECDEEEKTSCTGTKNTDSEMEITVGEKSKKSINSVVLRTNKETEVNHSVEEMEPYSASLSSFSSRVNSEVSFECHGNSDISFPSKRRRLNTVSVTQKRKDTRSYCHEEKTVSRRSREAVKYRHSIIALSQEQWKTASEVGNQDNETDNSCQPSEGKEVQNLLVSSLQKRMKLHKNYSETVVKTIANAAAELATCCQDEWQNMVKEYEEKVKKSFEKVNTILHESVSQQNEFHKLLKKYTSESQKRYMTIKEEAQVLSTCTKMMCESLGKIVSCREDICSQKIEETEKLLYQEVDQMIARERTKNRALVHEKVCHAFNKRK